MTTILGIGSALPRLRIDRQRAAEYAQTFSCHSDQQRRKLQVVYRRTGIGYRGSVLLEQSFETPAETLSDVSPGGLVVQRFYPPARSANDRGPTTNCRGQRFAEEAPALANGAAAAALADAAVDAALITHLVTITCTGFHAPGIDISLIDQLGLPPQTERVQVGFMGCHAVINGLRVAHGLVSADAAARVLLCSVELCSLHYQYGFDADRIVSGALFADGAAAMVLGRPWQDGSAQQTPAPADAVPLAVATQTRSGHTSQLIATGSWLVPHSRDAMTWRIGDHGFEMSLSARVPDLIRTHLRPFLDAWLRRHGQSLQSIGGWAVHPGGVRILSAVEESLALPAAALETANRVLSEHGNMSSATMAIILETFAAESQPKPWLMVGFGPGLEIEVALIG